MRRIKEVINIFIEVNFIKIILIILFVSLLSVKSSFSQYWSTDSVPEYFLIDSVYNTNTLIVDTILYEHLDHAISLIDSIDIIQKDSTWLHFVISLNPFFDPDTGKSIGIFLQQGIHEKSTTSQLIQIPGYEVTLCGTFVYKGYVFFVHSHKKSTELFNKLFIKSKLKEYRYYYYKLYYSDEYHKLENIPIQTGIHLFYDVNLSYSFTLKSNFN